MPALTRLFSSEREKSGALTRTESLPELSHLVVQCKEELLLTVQSRFEIQEALLRSLQSTVEELSRFPPRAGSMVGTGSNVGTIAGSGTPASGRSQDVIDGRKTMTSQSSKQELPLPPAPPAPPARTLRPQSSTTDSGYPSEVYSIVNRTNDALKELGHEGMVVQQTSREETSGDAVRWRRRRLNTSKQGSDLITGLRFVLTKWHLMPILHCLSFLVVLIDATVIAVETDQLARHGEDGDLRQTMMLIDYIVVSWYLTELIVRVLGERPMMRFFTGREWRWNVFDLCLTLMSAGDLALTDPTLRFRALSILRLLRMLRILRLLRMLRIFRIMGFLKEFHKLVLCLACSVQTLFPAMVLMCFFIFCVSILFTQVVATFLQEKKESVDPLVRHGLEDAFGTVSSSMLSLYMAITSGKNWGELYDLLHNVGPLQSFLFFMFLMTAIYGLTNVVTAVFVESAMRATQTYRELLVQEMLIKERVNVRHMKEIFYSIDLDGTGLITLPEMMTSMHDESLQLQEYFEALGLSASDTVTLFNLLDSDHSGAIDIDEFCEGCMRLGGNATNFDMNCMWHEQRRTNREILKFIQHACLGLHGLSKTHRNEAKDFSVVAGQIQQMLEKSEGSGGSFYGSNLQRNRTGESAAFFSEGLTKAHGSFASFRDQQRSSLDFGLSSSPSRDVTPNDLANVEPKDVRPDEFVSKGQQLERVTELSTGTAGSVTVSCGFSDASANQRNLSMASVCEASEEVRHRESL